MTSTPLESPMLKFRGASYAFTFIIFAQKFKMPNSVKILIDSVRFLPWCLICYDL